MKYGVKITKNGASIHVAPGLHGGDHDCSDGKTHGYLGTTWFGCSADIFDSEEAARASILCRMESAVALHQERLDAAKLRLANYLKNGPKVKVVK
jgi:hypothetical protein